MVAPLATGNNAKKQAQEAGLLVLHHMQWAEIVIGFCLASAIDIALLSVQGHSLPHYSFGIKATNCLIFSPEAVLMD